MTKTTFSVYGKSLIEERTFGAEKEYDNRYFKFAPIDKMQGEKVGDSYRFRIEVKALNSYSQNLFSFKIEPDAAETSRSPSA